jgi:hypothetical protein
LDFFLSLGPNAVHELSLRTQILFQFVKLLDDAFQALSKAWTGQILVDPLHFGLLP